MSSSALKKKVAAASGLIEVLEILAEHPKSSGALKISSGQVKGTVAFSQGKIIGAYVVDGEQDGNAAVDRLFRVPAPKIKYMLFDQTAIDALATEMRVDLDLKDILEQVRSATRPVELFDKEGQSRPEPPDVVPSEPALDAIFASEDGLTDEQRKMLSQASQSMADVEGFNASDDDFKALDEALDISETQQNLLDSATLDEKSFQDSDSTMFSELTPSLTEDQRKLLEVAKDSHDKEGFEERDLSLDEIGALQATKVSQDLQQSVAARSSEEQKAEFDAQGASLDLSEQTDFKPLVDHVVEQPEVSDLNAIAAPNVLDSDRAPLQLLPIGPKAEGKKELPGLLGKVDGYVRVRFGSYYDKRRRRTQFPVGKILGVCCLILLAIGVFTVPDIIKSSAANLSSAGLEEGQLSMAIRDDLSEDIPTVQQDETAHGGFSSSGGGGGTGAGGGVPDNSALQNDPLAYANLLVAEGKVEMAIPWYADYIRSNPNVVGPRMQLIRVYIMLKRPADARQLCIDTLKMKLTDAELTAVWDLMRRCLTD